MHTTRRLALALVLLASACGGFEPAPPAGSGWYCVGATGYDRCVRDASACAGMPMAGGVCGYHGTAWCYAATDASNVTCWATQADCATDRGNAAAGASPVSACVEEP